MRPISEHAALVAEKPVAHSSFLEMAHPAASRRAAARRDRDATVTETVDALIAEGGHDALLLGGVDGMHSLAGFVSTP